MNISQETLKELWESLTTSVDKRGYKTIFKDPKVQQASHTVFVEQNDAFALDFYKKDIESENEKIRIKEIPVIPTKETIESLIETPGIVSSVLINNENGVSGTPFVSIGGKYTELDVAASYFNVIGLLSSGNIALARQIAANITYMIGHQNSLKATNRSYHLLVRALPLYTSITRTISDYLPSIEERKKFLKIHISRSILEQQRSWEVSESVSYKGLNVFPKTEVDTNTLSFSIPNSNIISVRLNMMLYKTEKDIAFFLDNYTQDTIIIDGKEQTAEQWNKKAEIRWEAMQEVLWNKELNTYNDYDVDTQKFVNTDKADFIYAIWSEGLSQDEFLNILSNFDKYEMENGFQYDLNNENTKAFEQMIAWVGLNNYKESKKSVQLMSPWVNMVEKEFTNTKSLFWEYNVKTGKGIAQPQGNIFSPTLASIAYAYDVRKV